MAEAYVTPTRGLITVIIGFLIITCAPVTGDPPCVMGWSREFAPRGVLGGIHALTIFDGGTVQDLAVFDDGTGPALYAAGEANTSGPVRAYVRK